MSQIQTQIQLKLPGVSKKVTWKEQQTTTTIKSVQFGLLNPDEVRKFSVTQETIVNGKKIPAGITQTTLRDHTGDPIVGGLLDPRLGDPRNTPGFFGHCELAKPVYHINFIDTVISILRCVSYHTSELIIEPEILKEKLKNYRGKERLHIATNLCKGKRVCLQTGNPQPKYKKEKDIRISADFSEKDDSGMIREIRAVEALMILERISDETAEFLGFNVQYSRPEWLIMTVMPIPPLSVRPSVAINDSNKCEDDLTHKLTSIIKTNNELISRIEKNMPQEKIDEFVALLQYHISTFIDNQTTLCKQDKQRNGKPLRTLSQRLKGKEGRVRGNLMGKRVDFTSRTVITADPNLSLDQVGVPLEVAMDLTVPEMVTQFNIQKLQKCVDNGPDYFPGANYVVRKGRDGSDIKVDLKYARKVTLQVGWTVERHLCDNDPVMFNRQPSLHKMSLMGHRVRVLKGSTFRLNLSATSPYNADFDGDEMNLHVPQDILARTEIESFMMVDHLIVSPQSNRPVMGIVQDSLLGSALMTKQGVFLEEREFFTGMMYNTELWKDGKAPEMPHPAVFGWDESGKFKKYWTGKQLFSSVIPKNVFLTRKSSYFSGKEGCDNMMEDGYVNIMNGEIMSGIIDKKCLGTSHGGLIHIIFNDLGHHDARKFINMVQKVSNYWISTHSFTVGFGDTIADPATNLKISEILTNVKEDVMKIIDRRDKGQIEVLTGRTVKETFEHLVNTKLNKARDDAGKAAEKSLVGNAFNETATAGSKGSVVNISQIMAAVGQQNVEGKRIANGFEGRALPHFLRDDDGPEARGFVKNSYVSGLTPYEFFFHAMAGREGIIDTA